VIDFPLDEQYLIIFLTIPMVTKSNTQILLFPQIFVCLKVSNKKPAYFKLWNASNFYNFQFGDFVFFFNILFEDLLVL
jgi:hypothetical protein